MKRIILALAALLLTAFIQPAHADDFERANNMRPEYSHMLGAVPGHPLASEEARVERRVRHTEGSAVIGSRPSGCPHRFCGCALSIKLFGIIKPMLNLAANWKMFPSASPAPGMVAARYGHVFQLVSHVEGNIWTVWDANSGGGAIRIHQRSIAGYTIHNPHGALAAHPVNHNRYASHHRHRHMERS